VTNRKKPKIASRRVNDRQNILKASAGYDYSSLPEVVQPNPHELQPWDEILALVLKQLGAASDGFADACCRSNKFEPAFQRKIAIQENKHGAPMPNKFSPFQSVEGQSANAQCTDTLF